MSLAAVQRQSHFDPSQLPGGSGVAGGGALILTNRGDPVPPQGVVVAMRERYPELNIEWVNAYSGPYFGVFKRWREDDPRWEQVRNGSVDAAMARDLEYMFPRDCSTDSMLAYLEGKVGARGYIKDPKAEADRLIERAKRLYAEADQQNLEQAIDRSTDRFLEETPHSLRVRAGAEDAHPMVSGATFDPPPTPPASDGPKRLIEVAAP